MKRVAAELQLLADAKKSKVGVGCGLLLSR
jgi:hypothetical protein